jgi:hypothetical protein
MTPNEAITEVRRLIQDTKTPYRYSDTVLLGFVNQTLKKMVVLRPDLFAVIGDFTTVANTVLQSCPTDSVRLMQIFQIKNGDAVTEVSKETLDRMYPNWVNEAAGVPVNFMRHVRNANKFFVYPRPTAGVTLVGEYAQSPATYALNDTIALLPDAYLTSVVEGTVYLAESIDNEHVNSGRAKLFQDAFTQGLGVGLQARVVTDTEEGGLDPRQVI